MIKTMTELCVSSTVDTPRSSLISLTSRKAPGGRSKKGHKASRRSWRVGRSSGGGDAPPADDDADAKRIVGACPWLSNVPYIAAGSDLDRVADVVSRHYRGEFCWAASFEPRLVAALMARGFLTMAQRVGREGHALLPKMHRQRCALVFPDLHVSRSARRKAKQFSLSVDTSFDAVVAGIREQHGDECWFYPPLVEAFRTLHCQGSAHVKMRTFEVWDKTTGLLVAGELGYACGDVYTSLSGFSRMASAGAVQCAATAKLLARSGYVLWDLGMELPYKTKLGAQLLPRDAFLKRLRQARAVGALRLYPINKRECCRLLIDCPRVPVVSPPATDDSASATSETTASTDTV